MIYYQLQKKGRSWWLWSLATMSWTISRASQPCCRKAQSTSRGRWGWWKAPGWDFKTYIIVLGSSTEDVWNRHAKWRKKLEPIFPRSHACMEFQYTGKTSELLHLMNTSDKPLQFHFWTTCWWSWPIGSMNTPERPHWAYALSHQRWGKLITGVITLTAWLSCSTNICPHHYHYLRISICGQSSSPTVTNQSCPAVRHKPWSNVMKRYFLTFSGSWKL